MATRDTEDNFIALKYPVFIGQILGSKVTLKSGITVMTRKGYLRVSRIFEKYKESDFKKILVVENQRVAKDVEIGILKDGTSVKAKNPCIHTIFKEKTLLLINFEQEIELRNGTELHVKENDIVDANKKIASFDLFTDPIICEFEGTVKYEDVLPGNTMRERDK